MCCFTGPVSKVEGTSIFARMMAPGRQLLVYELSLAAEAEVAMVLPLPVPPRSGEDAVRFLNLKAAPDFFSRLETLFAPPQLRSLEQSLLAPRGEPLQVHAVGDFVASFVPSLADFSRLDPRFRMPQGTLDRVPDYADWGFAVFQLAAPKRQAKIHPMAFELQTRDAARLFFPTLHVHDGALHDGAEYAHFLYTQGGAAEDSWEASFREDWQQPTRVPDDLFDAPPAAKGLLGKILPALPSGRRAQQAATELMKQLVGDPATLRRRAIFGPYRNQDTWVPLAS